MEGDPEKGMKLLGDWVDPGDLILISDGVFTHAQVLVSRYTGGRLAPSQVRDMAAGLVVTIASGYDTSKEEA